MKFNRSLFIASLFCSLSGLALYDNYSTPPDGYTGAPDELSCNSCHFEVAAPNNTTIQLLDLPSEVIGGQVYPIRIKVTSDYGVQAGFEAVSLKDDLTNAGVWTNLGPGVTASASNSRRYAKHLNGPFMPDIGGGLREYTFNLSWRPSSTTQAEAVNIYVAGLAGAETEGQFDDSFANTTASTTVYRVLSGELLSSTRIRCNGSSTGSFEVVGIDGKQPYSYQWSTGATTAAISGLIAGDYSVTISDELGQSVSFDYTLSDPPVLEAAIGQEQDVSCPEGTNGILFAEVSGGTPDYTYSWSNGATGNIVENLPAGMYEVTVSDNVGCQMTASYELTEPPALSLALEAVQGVDCAGAANGALAVSADGGTPGYTYNWSNGGSGPEIDGLGPGDYTVTATDAEGCTETATYQVPTNGSLNVDLEELDDVSCAGGSDGFISVSASGGQGPYTYNWSNGQSGNILSDVSEGGYGLTVSDALGCEAITTYMIEEAAALDLASLSVQDVDCFGGSDGSISLQGSGGTPPYSYQWNIDVNGNTINNLSAGEYTVTVFDAVECTYSMSFEIAEPANLVLNNGEISPISCADSADGAIAMSVSGGTPPLHYQWNTGATTSLLNNLVAGDYSATITDANGCTLMAEYELSAPDPIALSEIQISDTSCADSADGSISGMVSGGTPPYTYQWPSGATNYPISGLASGEYVLTITDSEGCNLQQSFAIDAPPALELATDLILDATCFDQANGSASVSASGGVSPYSYFWDTGNIDSAISNAAAGNYGVTATDDNGCTTTSSVAIGEPDPWAGSVQIVESILCFDAATGVAEVIPQGGTPPYSYQWPGGESTAQVSGLPPGGSTVSITDSEGCQYEETVFFTDPDPLLIIVADLQNAGCNGEANGSISVEGSGGIMPYTLVWEDGSTNFSRSMLAAGDYALTLTDDNGCESFLTIPIQEAGSLQPAISELIAVSCAGDTDGSLSLDVSGGEPPYSISWSTGATTNSISQLPGGSYTATITDQSGCSIISTFELPEPDVISLDEVSITDVVDEVPGSISVIVAGGSPPYSYAWTGPEGFSSSTATISELVPGTYSLTVTDANGCTFATGDDDSFTVSFVTDVEELSTEAPFQLFPNPVREQLQLLSSESGPIAIYSLQGQVVWTGNTAANTALYIPVRDWPAGVYVVRLLREGQVWVKRVVVL